MKRLLLLLTLVAMTGAATPNVTSPSDPTSQLGMWAGRWNFSGQIYGTPYSRAHSDTGIADCVWTANRGYVICEYFSDDPPHDNLAILSYNAAVKTYTLAEVNKETPPDRLTLTQRENTWSTIEDVARKGKMLVMRTLFTFLSSDRQLTTVQVSADKGKTWTKIIEVTSVKARVPA